MPYYEIHHSFPLETQQKHALAQAITKLHSHTFTTPSFFVNVKFAPCDATDKTYYIAGEPKTCSTNRIHANVRVGNRTKADFDALAEKLEQAWYDVVKGEVITDGKGKGKRAGEVDEREIDREAKDLLMVAFYPMVSVRERGMTISEAGKEAEFYEQYLPYMKKQVVEKGDEDFKQMLEELETRDDLKKLVAGPGGLTGLMEKLGMGKKEEHKKEKK